MAVYHLSAPDKGALIAQIADLLDEAERDGRKVSGINVQPPVGGSYKAIVTVEDGDA